MILPIAAGHSSWPVAVPWPGERLSIAVVGGEGSSARTTKVRTPVPPTLPAAFTARANADTVASTLVTDPNSNLPMVAAVWRKVPQASHYEVQYTFRTRSSNADQRRTKVTRIVRASQIHNDSNTAGHYTTLSPSWSQHPNASVLNALNDSDLNTSDGEDGEWVGALTTLPKLLAGAEGWPQDESQFDTAEADIIAALSAGQNAVGVRVRPVAACADYYNNPYMPEADDDPSNTLCATRPDRMAALALRGKKSVISYVRFEGANMGEWVSSAGAAR